jgi:low affinity Fe/Cu permease
MNLNWKEANFRMQGTGITDVILENLTLDGSKAHNEMIDIEKLSDAELDELEKRYAAICQSQRNRTVARGAGKKVSSIP